MSDLYIEKVKDDAKLPFYVHEGDAGMDICAYGEHVLEPGVSKAIPTGLILHIPKGYEIQVRPRSGLSLKTRLRLPNSPGTIDSGFKDELHILMHNSSYLAETEDILFTSEKQNRQGIYKIQHGERIAQLVMAPVIHANIIEGKADEHSEMSADRGGGFGHSGV